MTIPLKRLRSGFGLPALGLGTWTFGEGNDKEDISSISAAIGAGITHIDTAEIYGGGHCEEVIGEAIAGLERKNLFIASKVHRANCGSARSIVASCEASLRRLKTDYLDLYMLHSYRPDYDLRTAMGALNLLAKEGLIRNIGVSNFSKERLAEAQSFSKRKIVADQVQYSLVFREPETTGLLDYCRENDVFLVAFRPLESGSLASGKMVEALASRYKKTPAQISLSWLTSQENVAAIPKFSARHAEEDIAAAGWRMPSEDIEFLRENFPARKAVSQMFPLR